MGKRCLRADFSIAQSIDAHKLDKKQDRRSACPVGILLSMGFIKRKENFSLSFKIHLDSKLSSFIEISYL